VPQSDATEEIVTPPPSEKTIYVVHFDQPIEESFLSKTFSMAGPIRKIHLGKFRPRASKRKNKRTIHFALIVYKEKNSCQRVLEDSKFLQGRINKVAKATMGFTKNPFLEKDLDIDDQSDSEPSDTEVQAKVQKAKMEEDGFTLVEAEAFKPKRLKARDAFATVVKGTTREKALEQIEAKRRKN
jgi:hypothetical protein